MDELNNNFQNTAEKQVSEDTGSAKQGLEEPYVQRPSQKYGRTAYQQQMNAQIGGAQGQQQGGESYHTYGTSQNQQPYGNSPYGQPNQSYGSNPYGQPNQSYGSNPYGQPYQPYGSNPYGQPYQPYNGMQREKVHGTVSNLFGYILMVLVAVNIMINLVVYKLTFDVIGAMPSVNYLKVVEILGRDPAYTTLVLLSQMISIAVIVFLILDIVKIYRANYKIAGLVLFAIFLKPAYFIWRAYTLGQKKAVPVIYAVLAYGISIVVVFFLYYRIIMDVMYTVMR